MTDKTEKDLFMSTPFKQCPSCGGLCDKVCQRTGDNKFKPERDEKAERTWVGLTEDEVYRIAFELEGEHWKKIAEAIEAKLKEKNI